MSSEAVKVDDCEYLSGGKWAAGDDPPDEQVDAAERVREYITVKTAPTYTEPPSDSRQTIATVRGFWMRDEEDKQTAAAFIVLLDIEDETVQVRFPLFDTESADTHNHDLKSFLRTCSVTTDSLSDLIGRRVYVKDKRASGSKYDDGFAFSNRARTPYLRWAAGIGATSTVVGCFALFLHAFVGLTLLGAGCIIFLLSMAVSVAGELTRSTVPKYKIEEP